MKNKGFTLAELLGVITLLAVIAAITIPVMHGVIGNSKNKTYDEQIRLIENGAKNWYSKNSTKVSLDINGDYFLTLDALKSSEFIGSDDIINPDNNEVMNGCININYNEDTKKFSYNYMSSCEKKNYEGDCFVFSDGVISGYNTTDTSCPTGKIIIPTTIYDEPVTKIEKGTTSYFTKKLSTFDLTNAFYLEELGDEFLGYTTDPGHTLEIETLDLRNNIKLKRIGKMAFLANKKVSIDTLYLPKNLEVIDEAAFNNTNLTKVYLNSNLKTINEKAFTSNNITNLTIPRSVKEIGYNAFSKNSLKEVIMDGKKDSSDFDVYDDPFADNGKFTDESVTYK